MTPTPRNRVPGAGSEPVAIPGTYYVHRIEITSKRVGWYFWAFCSCGWTDTRQDRRELEIEARLHSLKAGAA